MKKIIELLVWTALVIFGAFAIAHRTVELAEAGQTAIVFLSAFLNGLVLMGCGVAAVLNVGGRK